MIKPFIAENLKEVQPAVLAYIGDSVFELYARCHVAAFHAGTSQKMHTQTIEYVNAKAQAKAMLALKDELTEEEDSYYRRGRNSNPHSVSKNSDIADYMNATGFEALMGYLFLDNQTERMEYLLYTSFDIIDDKVEL